MYPRVHAATHPEKPALIMADSGISLSYSELERKANQAAHFFRQLLLKRGDVIAVMLGNSLHNLQIAWGAQRSGLYLTCVSTRLSTEDFAYILRDSDARLLITSSSLADKFETAINGLTDLQCRIVDGDGESECSWTRALHRQPTTPISDESQGGDMLYSSGTTGRPKGVKPKLSDGPIDEINGLVTMGEQLYSMDENSRFYSPAPLYHAAPLRWCMAVHRLGGTVVFSEKFDERQALSIIEKYRITHAQWVPTHFYRLLNLPVEERGGYDHSSLVAVFHAAAPCPPNIKHAMIDWWGPIVHEYYSGTECPGITAISADEWLQKPGSVGKAIWGEIRICDDNGEELPQGDTGMVFFSNGPTFEYHKDPGKTLKSRNKLGWATMGDVGYVDQDGYLFLSDRKDFMIISGGVNIYPQEIENCLMENDLVSDVAVFGIPDVEMGEKVVAIIQSTGSANREEAAQLLTDYCLQRLGRIKTPREFYVRSEIPRLPTGKIQKKVLRERLLQEQPGTG